MKVLVTGASGFVGTALIQSFVNKENWQIVAAVHDAKPDLPSSVQCMEISGLTDTTEWNPALVKVDVVVHLAARVHVMNDAASNPLVEFRDVNVAGTLQLARQAAKAGVKRFVYLSSVKVNGEFTEAGRLFKEDDIPAPQDPYSVSKHEAEEGLRLLAKEYAMAVTIIRPPLVYGEGVKANFRHMLQWVEKRVPLPLGSITNRRSLVALDNLVDFIKICMVHPRAANETFLVADREDLSTPELLRRAGKALGKPALLMPIPTRLLFFIAIILGQKERVQRLCGSLQLDTTKARTLLGWKPPLSVDEGLRLAVQGICAAKKMKNELLCN